MNIKEIIKYYGIKPKEKLGQTFLVNESVLKREVEYAEISKHDTVLEIGCGLGSLTKFLVKYAKKVYAIEKDLELIKILKNNLKAENLEIIHGDVLKIEFPKFDKVVSNIPYTISSPITFKILKYDFKKAILTYQKEFAERLIAKPGEKNYSRISVACSYYARVKILEYLPPSVFYPKPKITSAIVEIKKRKSPPFKIDEKKYFSLVKDLFIHKKKTVRKALICSKRKKLVEALPDYILKRRVFSLSPEEIAEILKYEN